MPDRDPAELAREALRIGFPEVAVQLLRAWLAAHPSDVTARRLWLEAARAWRQATPAHPARWFGASLRLVLLAVPLSIFWRRKLVHLCEDAIELDPTEPTVLQLLAATIDESPDASRAILEEARRCHPDDRGIQASLAQLSPDSNSSGGSEPYRRVTLVYHERMYPNRTYPLIVRFDEEPPEGLHDETTFEVVPDFPGFFVAPPSTTTCLGERVPLAIFLLTPAVTGLARTGRLTFDSGAESVPDVGIPIRVVTQRSAKRFVILGLLALLAPTVAAVLEGADHPATTTLVSLLAGAAGLLTPGTWSSLGGAFVVLSALVYLRHIPRRIEHVVLLPVPEAGPRVRRRKRP